ncbi:hypothetical protein MIMGU_mgv1a014422mg [Erythranthe guttata]|uniref:RING-type domain-containing protein n=1 Tax=Erythranthe guttata TaxID=4155 RepID=A0A022RET1_ERYGU|nr:hypothetical protein MIMGU_mgv1a014422mg [Erythranthe guttata]
MKYEYNYRFTVLREIKTSYIYQIRPGKKEIRTSFIVKKTDGVYQIIDSEMYGTELHGVEESDVSKIFENKLIYRLEEYYMSKEEIDKFKHMSLVFAKQVEADPEYNLSDTISLVGLPRTRFDDFDEGSAPVNPCEICLQVHTIGDVITVMPCCSHAFHALCVVQRLLQTNQCPSCSSRAYDPKVVFTRIW